MRERLVFHTPELGKKHVLFKKKKKNAEGISVWLELYVEIYGPGKE